MDSALTGYKDPNNRKRENVVIWDMKLYYWEIKVFTFIVNLEILLFLSSISTFKSKHQLGFRTILDFLG